jgi:hypothetical protein
VLLRCPLAGPFLAQDFVNFSFRKLVEKRGWSWLQKTNQFIVNTVYNTGNADVTFNQNTVVGHGTTWTAAMVGRQFRIGLSNPIYTITAVGSATSLTLDQPFGGATTLGVGYQIYNAYVTVPSDFHHFISVYDPQFAWQLWWNVKQDELNAWDAQRASAGTAYCVAQQTYDTTVTPPLPRYEIWPHQFVQKPFPFVYISRPPDLNDAGASLPRYITGDVIMDGALAEAARWPGPDKDHPNPYFNLNLSLAMERLFNEKVRTCEVQDDEVYMQDVSYGQLNRMPWAPFPLGDAAFIQAHAI